MGQKKNNSRPEWAVEAVDSFVGMGMSPESVVTALLTFLAQTAPDKGEFDRLMGLVGAVATDLDKSINNNNLSGTKAEPEPEPEPEPLPPEVLQVASMLGIDPKALMVIPPPRAAGKAQAQDSKVKSGKYSGMECDCPACMVSFGSMFSREDGEA